MGMSEVEVSGVRMSEIGVSGVADDWVKRVGEWMWWGGVGMSVNVWACGCGWGRLE